MGYTGTGIPSNGERIGIAVDLDLGRLWISRNNSWLTGNPSTNTTPIATGLSGTYYPVNYGWGSATATSSLATLAARASACLYAPPTGFNYWDGSNAPTVNWDYSSRHEASGSWTRSADGLTLSCAGGSHDMRATRARCEGKYYVEYKVNSTTGNTIAMGIIDSTIYVSGSFGGSNVYGAWGLSNGSEIGPNSFGSSGASLNGTENVGQIAVDLTLGKIWFGVNNTWISGNPNTNTSGSFTGLVLTREHYPAIYISGPTASVTGRFKLSDFSYAPPTGFFPWQS